MRSTMEGLHTSPQPKTGLTVDFGFMFRCYNTT